MTRDLQLAKRIRGDRFWFIITCNIHKFLNSLLYMKVLIKLTYLN
jgi:hypothetical protein